jgi:hypothetical protein
MSCRALLVVVLVLGCLGDVAATSISFGPYGGYWNIDTYAPLGQTFKATSRQISRVGVWAAPWGNPNAFDAGLRIELFEETGAKGEQAFAGKYLGGRRAFENPVDEYGQGWADAWFSTVDLTPGRTYSFRVTDVGASATDGGIWQVSQSTWGSVYPDGVSIRNGIIDYTWEDLAFRVLDAIVANGTFTTGNTQGWTPRAEGFGSVGTRQRSGSDYAARLTAGSEVGMSQAINTLAEPFFLAFDYAFRAAGALEVSLGSEQMAFIEAGEAGEFVSEKIAVRDPSLLGLSGGLLDFSFNGETGAELLLDNIYIEPVPEPTFSLLLIAGLLRVFRRRS